jgi:hypothetical protein
MRVFQMIRDTDVTGLSGTGVVAEVIEFSDGSVAMRWLQDGVSKDNFVRGVRATTVLHESLMSVQALHGHNGMSHLKPLRVVDGGGDI